MRNPGLAMLTALAIALFMAVAILTDMASAQTATPTTTPTPTANPAAVVDDMIACWEMDELEGVRYDAFGANHLSDNNTVSSAGAGKTGRAAAMIATNSEYLSVADSAKLSFSGSGDDFTILMWVYQDSSTTGTLIHKGSVTTAPGMEYEIISYFDRTIAIKLATASVVLSYSAPAWMEQNQWNLVGLRVDQSESDISIIVANTVSGIQYDQNFGGYVSMYDGSGNLCLGALCAASIVTYYSGYMDDVMLSDRALSNAEIAWLYNSGYGRSCAEVIGAAGTPTATATVAATATPNPALATVALSTEAALQLERRVSYGDISTVAAIGLLGILVVAYMLIRLQVGR